MKLKAGIKIRRMKELDLEEVMEIERKSFHTPWSRSLFERELATSFARAFVACEFPAERVIGYLCLWLVASEAHILNLAVHPERRGQGIGTLLLEYAIDYCRQKETEEITLEVRRSNYQAISLYRNLHFLPLGIRPRYYSDNGEDAVLMGLRLMDQPPAAPL